ncbi:MAG TPA: hypothetical protein VLX91_12730 [Candidatus Acidoferrales bacterium]|nr:hypothetical protein [Candidatus Acidoferrales bacterium]
MSLILRIDVDRPYGRRSLSSHVMSRIGSDFYFPAVRQLGYLHDLELILNLLNDSGLRSYVFFRRCTLPSGAVMRLIEAGGHVAGLHLENSRSFENFQNELRLLEWHLGCKVSTFSKHGSGVHKYGLHHYAPYEPEKYLSWAEKSGMKIFMGNLEDPTILPRHYGDSILFFPSAFWLEPHWRDTKSFTIEWLVNEARTRDVVLLFHPENVIVDAKLMEHFKYIICNSESKIF